MGVNREVAHQFMNHFHKPTDEKRIFAIMPPEHYQKWLDAEVEAMRFMVQFSAEQLRSVTPAPTN